MPRRPRAPSSAQEPDNARQIVELGYKGKDFMSREEFEAAKKAALEGPLKRKKSLDAVCSAGKDLSKYPFLYALAQREELVRNGKLSTIIFIRDVIDKKGHEVSGYIDYGHRLKVAGAPSSRPPSPFSHMPVCEGLDVFCFCWWSTVPGTGGYRPGGLLAEIRWETANRQGVAGGPGFHPTDGTDTGHSYPLHVPPLDQ